MRNKKNHRYSYVNHDSRGSKFINKNFNKTESYHSNFSNASFENTAFIGAKLKFCSLYAAVFDSCYIRGTLFRNCNLESSIFRNSIISATVFENCNLKRCKFENCKIISSTKFERLLPNECFVDTEIFQTYLDRTNFTPTLILKVEELRSNDFIRKSSVLHRKEKKIDTIALKVLVDIFGEDFLIEHLEELPKMITKEFYTLSYLAHFLHKIRKYDKKKIPGPAALGAPKLTNDCSSTD